MPKPKKNEVTGERTYEFKSTVTTRIVLTKACKVVCSHCGKVRPLQLRTMPDGTIRNQPQCGPCRSRYDSCKKP